MEICNSDIVKKAVNTIPLKVLTVLIGCVVLYGMGNTHVYYAGLTPFAIGLVFALLFVGFDGYVLSGMYAISYLLGNWGLNGFVIVANVGMILSSIQVILRKKNIKIKKIYIIICSLLSQITYVLVNLGDGKQNLALFVSIILGQLFLFVCLSFLDATINKGMLNKINIDEKICGSVILIVFSMGICNTYINIICIGLAALYYVVLLATYVSSCGVSMIIGGLVGIGLSIFYLNPIYISLFAIISLMVTSFKCKFRFVSVVAGILTYIVFSLIFDMGLSIGEIIGLGIGGVGFCLTPRSILQSFVGVVNDKRALGVQGVFNCAKSQVVSRVKELSKVFAEMNTVYRNMVKGNMSDDDARQLLKEELVSDVCSKCPNFNNCFRLSNSFMDNCFDIFIAMGYEKGKLTLIDLPEYITTNCNKVNALVQQANRLLSAYIDYSSAITNLDTSRMLIADQLSGVSLLLDALGKEVDIDVSFNGNYEKLIKENLAYHGITCAECIVYERCGENKIINLIVNNNNINAHNIEQIVTKSLKRKFKIITMEDGMLINTKSIMLGRVPEYDIVFGSAVVTKTGCQVSGDSYMVVDIGNGKYMMSICDGMGSGEGANRISKLASNLIENFYRAGFDNEIILSSVNKLLSLTELETFSTVDLCVVDGKHGVYDFIKLGANSGYIKHSNGEIEEVLGSGLPVGVLEDIKPHIIKKCIVSMDMLIFVSDGVGDILGDDIKSVLRNLDSINPQTLADDILRIALDRNGGVSLDDMTVLCARVFEAV